MDEHRLADRYEPIEVLGRGGEATVIKAVDTRHDRLVALKIRPMPPGETPEALFVEARALLSLPPHPGLAHARRRPVRSWPPRPRARLGRRDEPRAVLAEAGRPGLPVSSVLRWSAQAAEVLTFLHGHGVVHGDVKPANLIIDGTGRVVVVDLGSSSVPMSDAARGGTPGFRAPEIAGGAVSTARRRVQPGRDRVRAPHRRGADGWGPDVERSPERRRRAPRDGAPLGLVDRSGPPSRIAGCPGRALACRLGRRDADRCRHRDAHRCRWIDRVVGAHTAACARSPR